MTGYLNIADQLRRIAAIREIQVLLGHRSLTNTSRYLKIATSTVCATVSPIDLLPKAGTLQPAVTAQVHF